MSSITSATGNNWNGAVLMHGMPGDSSTWAQVAPDLAAIGYQVLTPDHRPDRRGTRSLAGRDLHTGPDGGPSGHAGIYQIAMSAYPRVPNQPRRAAARTECQPEAPPPDVPPPAASLTRGKHLAIPRE